MSDALQILQVVGSLLILAPFAATQLRGLPSKAVAYLLPNLAGSASTGRARLARAAMGLLAAEGVWALVSAHGLRRARAR